MYCLCEINRRPTRTRNTKVDATPNFTAIAGVGALAPKL